jgi:putative membrane protein
MSLRFVVPVSLGPATAALAMLLAAPAFADPPAEFLKEAIQGNIAEVQMGTLAQKNGGSEAVKSLGKTLEADHGKARDQTVSLAKTMKLNPPAEPSAEAKEAYSKLAKLSGTAFDREFANHMVMDHKKDIAKYTEEAGEKNGDVSKYAADTLPTLKKHLAMAENLAK